MSRRLTNRVLFVVPLLSAAFIVWAEGSLPAADAVAKGPAPKLTGRLPAYYKQVVSDGQRQKIYAIQERYRAKIAALKSELAKLEQQRDSEVAAVLTAEQKAKVENSRAAAKAAKAEKKAAALPAQKPVKKPPAAGA